jgi:hypothetical protein
MDGWMNRILINKYITLTISTGTIFQINNQILENIARFSIYHNTILWHLDDNTEELSGDQSHYGKPKICKLQMDFVPLLDLFSCRLL